MAIRLTSLAVLSVIGATAAQAQGAEPALLNISREFEKAGHFGPHQAVEARWAALSRDPALANSIALVAVSGPPEIWWISGYPSYQALDKANAYQSEKPGFSQATARLALEDSDHITGQSSMQARAVPEAGFGPFPDLARARLHSVTTVRMRPGFEGGFVDGVKHLAMVAGTASGASSWRAFEVFGGAPQGTFLILSAFTSWAAVAANEAAMAKAEQAAPAHMEAIGKILKEGVVSIDTRYFGVDPQMSYASSEMIAADKFWAPKPIAAKKAP